MSVLLFLLSLQGPLVVLAQLAVDTTPTSNAISTRDETIIGTDNAFVSFSSYPDATGSVSSPVFISMDAAAPSDPAPRDPSLTADWSAEETASSAWFLNSPSGTEAGAYTLPVSLTSVDPCVTPCLASNQFWSMSNCWETEMTDACVCLEAPLAALSHIAKCVSRSCGGPTPRQDAALSARSASSMAAALSDGAPITAAPRALPDDPYVLESRVAAATSLYNSYCHQHFFPGQIGVAVENEMTRTGLLPDATAATSLLAIMPVPLGTAANQTTVTGPWLSPHIPAVDPTATSTSLLTDVGPVVGTAAKFGIMDV